MSEATDRLLRIRERARTAPRPAAQAAPVEVPAAVACEPRDGLERRESLRRSPAGAQIALRRIGGFNFQVDLYDLSEGGCRVECVEGCDVGESVIGRFPGLEPLGASVRWTEGHTAGLQFMRPVHPAVLERLVRHMS